jgi:hypothetical protein
LKEGKKTKSKNENIFQFLLVVPVEIILLKHAEPLI